MLNQYKWNGFEEFNIQERHIENYLFDNGYCLFFEDKMNGKLCLPCTGVGKQNVYGDYLKYRATGYNYSEVVTAENSVLIENNKMRMPTQKAVIYFVSRLFELVRTMDVNVRQLKLQTLFTATDKNVLTVKKIIDEIDKNNWAIVTDTGLAVDEIVKAVQTGVKCLTPELTDRYNAVMNEALTYFGINNSNTDKRERLITDEANANNQFIDSCAEMFLESRVRACEEINKKFGLHVSVELRNKREEVKENDQRNESTDPE
jgi:predicted nucleic acid-binding protein